MSRTEFTRATKRDALERSGGKCEASGPRYGLEEGQRCNCSLSVGVIFDHDNPDQMGGDNSLENCRSICITCNKFKTRGDIREIRKSDRIRDKNSRVIRPAGKLKGPGFAKAAKPDRVPKDSLPPLPRRPLYTPNTENSR
ncbi:HNH endonuclease [Neorhizobium sp. P12A]|nr:HNH endonuclease [Neorhizobium sp. P12A]